MRTHTATASGLRAGANGTPAPRLAAPASRGSRAVARVAQIPSKADAPDGDAFKELQRLAALATKAPKQSVNRPQKVGCRHRWRGGCSTPSKGACPLASLLPCPAPRCAAQEEDIKFRDVPRLEECFPASTKMHTEVVHEATGETLRVRPRSDRIVGGSQRSECAGPRPKHPGMGFWAGNGQGDANSASPCALHPLRAPMRRMVLRCRLLRFGASCAPFYPARS